jgi:hypothetical protein
LSVDKYLSEKYILLDKESVEKHLSPSLREKLYVIIGCIEFGKLLELEEK